MNNGYGKSGEEASTSKDGFEDVHVDLGSLQIQDNVVISFSPGDSKYYVPICSDELKPFVGQIFPILKDAFEFYEKYAKHVGFKVRPGSQVNSKDDSNIIVWKYLLCSKEGHKPSKKDVKNAKGKRLKSTAEKIRDSSSKEKRTCGRCFESGHNSRTCSKVL